MSVNAAGLTIFTIFTSFTGLSALLHFKWSLYQTVCENGYVKIASSYPCKTHFLFIEKTHEMDVNQQGVDMMSCIGIKVIYYCSLMRYISTHY